MLNSLNQRRSVGATLHASSASTVPTMMHSHEPQTLSVILTAPFTLAGVSRHSWS